jgi:Ribosomal protein S21e
MPGKYEQVSRASEILWCCPLGKLNFAENFWWVCYSSWTNKLITAKDHASVQINIGNLDANGLYNGTYSTFALAGNVRSWVRSRIVYR